MGEMSADHIAKMGGGGGFEPQRTNNWTLEIEPGGLGQVGPTPDAAAAAGVLGGLKAVIKHSLRSFTFPQEENSVIAIPFMNTTRKVAGSVTYRAFEMVVIDYVNEDTLKMLMDWRRRVFRPFEGSGGLTDGGVGLAKDYKVTGKLILLGPNGLMKRNWELKGMWPSSIDTGRGEYGPGEDNRITVSYQVDRVVEKVLTAGAAGAQQVAIAQNAAVGV